MEMPTENCIEKSTASSTGDTEKAKKKIYWRCCVPGCRSNKSILRHAFPKDVRLSNTWKSIIKNPDLDELTTEALRNYRVCQLHFSERSYTITSVRRILRNDAVPELLLDLTSSIQTKIANESVDSSIKMELEEALVNIDTTKSAGTSDKEKESSGDLRKDNDDAGSFPEKDISREKIPNSTCSAPKTSKKRPILGPVTRKKNLTPVAARRGISTKLLKRQSKYVKGVEIKELSSLSKEQLEFMTMQIRNVHKKARAGVPCDPSCRFH